MRSPPKVSEVLVSDDLEIDGAERPRPTLLDIQFHACNRCTGMRSALSVLDSRSGKSYRLYKCGTCGDLSWAEEG
jgi:hypothetical protein